MALLSRSSPNRSLNSRRLMTFALDTLMVTLIFAVFG